MIVGFPGRDRRRLRGDAVADRGRRYHSMFSFKYSPRPNTLAEQAAGRRCGGGGEDAPDRGAAGAAARHPDRAQRGARRADGGGPGGCARAAGATTELSGRTSGNVVVNLPGAGGLDRPDGAGPGRARGAAQRLGRSLTGARRSLGDHANRNEHQGADGRSDHEHADRDPARQGRAAGAADLGRASSRRTRSRCRSRTSRRRGR